VDAAAVDAADLADATNRALVELSARFAHAFLRWLDASADDGLTYPRLSVLEALHCNGPAKMKTLADRLGLSARNLTTVADALETEGLIRRAAHPNDRRATLLELTPVGKTAADQSLGPRLEIIGRLFDELTTSDRTRFASDLTTLVAAMESGPLSDAAPPR